MPGLLALPLAVAALIGGLAGALLSTQFKAKNLKLVFALTSLLAAILMLWNALR